MATKKLGQHEESQHESTVDLSSDSFHPRLADDSPYPVLDSISNDHFAVGHTLAAVLTTEPVPTEPVPTKVGGFHPLPDDDTVDFMFPISMLSGDEGNNTIDGGDGRYILFGQGGDDLLNGGAGGNVLIGGTGNDTLNGGADDDSLNGDAGDDVANGNKGNDDLRGLAGKDVLRGGEGNDTVQGGEGNDIVVGGEGNDVLAGDDLLYGFAGRVFSTSNNDTLTGGAGEDIFVFASFKDGNGIATVLDFASGSDHILFFIDSSTSIHDDNLVQGAGALALDANDYLIFDSSTGALYYDADGNGAGEAFQFATLKGVTMLTADDFVNHL